MAAIRGAFATTRATGQPMDGRSSTEGMSAADGSAGASMVGVGGVTTGAFAIVAAATWVATGRPRWNSRAPQVPATMPKTTAAATDAYIAAFRMTAPAAVEAVTAECDPSAGNSHSTGGLDSAVDAVTGIEASVTNDERPGATAPSDETRVSRARPSRRFMTESDRDAIDTLADGRSERTDPSVA